MTDFVGYHNAEKMDGSFQNVDNPFEFLMNKPVDHLVGERIWIVNGEGHPRQYSLGGWFIIDKVGPSKDARFSNYVRGEKKGKQYFKPMIPLDKLPWFPRFRESQSNFSLGLHPISDEFIRYLEALAPEAARANASYLPRDAAPAGADVPPLRILIGTADEDIKALARCARDRTTCKWIVPKNAARGDDALVFVRGRGLVASCVILSKPLPGAAIGKAARFWVKIGEVSMISPPITEEELSERFPGWAWTGYPKTYTTAPAEIAGSLGKLVVTQLSSGLLDPELIEATEGALRLRRHLVAERASKLVSAKKEEVRRKTGRLACKVCGFDFQAVYGARGRDFCEVHHVELMSQSKGPRTTRLEDLVVLCSNCHRMLHRRPLLSPDELRKVLQNSGLP